MGKKKIRTVICDDVEAVCEGYRMFMELDDELECVGTVYSAEKCFEVVRETKPDLLLLDIQMETEKAGIDIIPELLSEFKNLIVLMLTSHSDSDYIFLAMLNRAHGYIVKGFDGDKVIAEVKEQYYKAKEKTKKNGVDIMEAFRGETEKLYNSRNSLLYMMNHVVKLSPYEFDILKDIYNGMKYKEIAQKRVVEECTVRTEASRIIKKFEVDSMKSLIKALKDLQFFDSL